MNDVIVSINCITYNHENYISDAIESFLMQKTDFNYEILIGEDCSTDNTRKIIEDYIKKYPNKIRMIASDHNVGGRKNSVRLTENSRGKYIAVCEGDDYWTDPYKLQKQVDYMEKHEGCSACFHQVEIVDTNKKSKGKFFKPYGNKNNNKFFTEDIVLSLGGMIHMSSLLYRKSLVGNLPDWFYESPVGDFPRTLILSSKGYFYYFNEVMSNYRKGVKSSAMARLFNEEKLVATRESLCEMLDNFCGYTDEKYRESINKAKIILEADTLLKLGKFDELKSPKYKVFFNSRRTDHKIQLYIKVYFPTIYRCLMNLLKVYK